MQIAVATKATPLKDVQIDSSICKLFVVIEYTDKNLNRPNINPMRFKILPALDKIKLSVERQTENGTENILMPMGLGTLGEIAANMEGHINSICYIAGNTGINVEMQIPIAPASLSADAGKYLLLSLDTSEFEFEDLKIWLYSLEVPVLTRNHVEYRQHKVIANTIKTLSTRDLDLVSFPRKDFQSVDFVYPNKTVTYKGVELKAIPQGVENLIANYVAVLNGEVDELRIELHSQSYYDGINYHTIRTKGMSEIRVLYSDDANIITTQLSK